MEPEVLQPYKSVKYISIIFLLSLLIEASLNPLFAGTEKRWYDQQQVDQGQILFQQNCATCHGQNAESIPNWKQTDANGNYPPPPLNGSAHAWHHDLPLLQRTVREGGQKLGGLMPPFEQLLNVQEINSVISFFQSKWSDDIYRKWAGRFDIKSSTPSLLDLKKLIKPKPDISFLQQRLGKAKIGPPTQSAIPNLYEIKFNDKTLYLTEDGQFAIIGDLIDLKKGINLSK